MSTQASVSINQTIIDGDYVKKWIDQQIDVLHAAGHTESLTTELMAPSTRATHFPQALGDFLTTHGIIREWKDQILAQSKPRMFALYMDLCRMSSEDELVLVVGKHIEQPKGDPYSETKFSRSHRISDIAINPIYTAHGEVIGKEWMTDPRLEVRIGDLAQDQILLIQTANGHQYRLVRQGDLLTITSNDLPDIQRVDIPFDQVRDRSLVVEKKLDLSYRGWTLFKTGFKTTTPVTAVCDGRPEL